LAKDGIVATERLDQAVAAYDSAMAQQQSAQETLNCALALVQMAQAESRRVQLSLDQVQTQQYKVRESEALKGLAIAELQRLKMKEDMVHTLPRYLAICTAEKPLPSVEDCVAWFWFSFLWYDAWPERISLVHTCPFGSYFSDLRMGSILCKLFPVRTFDGYSGTHP
jgi:hypothetical protein